MIYDRQKEIDEALEALDNAFFYLKEAKEYLESASGWGFIDILGGGFLTTMLKRRQMDRAQGSLNQAKDALKNLKNELNDIQESIDIHIEIGEFLSFADYFFDGVIADWMVQNKIKEAKEQVNHAIKQLENIRSQLVAIKG